jgi:FtsH-binding integral membrane protein
MVAMICSFYNYTIVLMAGALTLAATIALTIYAFYTKTDFTTCGGFLFVCVLVMIIGGILAAIFRSYWLGLGLSILGAIVFGLYLIMDTQLIIGKNQNMFSIDDYIMAAMNLYIDIIQLFLYILRILGATTSNN